MYVIGCDTMTSMLLFIIQKYVNTKFHAAIPLDVYAYNIMCIAVTL